MAHFQATVQRGLKGLSYITWVDHIVTQGTGSDDLLHTLEVALGRLERVNLNAAVRKHVLYLTSIQRCGKVYPGGVVKHA